MSPQMVVTLWRFFSNGILKQILEADSSTAFSKLDHDLQ